MRCWWGGHVQQNGRLLPLRSTVSTLSDRSIPPQNNSQARIATARGRPRTIDDRWSSRSDRVQARPGLDTVAVAVASRRRFRDLRSDDDDVVAP